MNVPTFNWQQKGWPKATFDRAALRDELRAFADAAKTFTKTFKGPQNMEVVPLVLPVSTIIARHRAAYYDEINEASRSLDWTNWCAFFIPVLTEMLTGFVVAHPGVKVPYLHSVVSASRATIERVIAAMVAEGKIEHRGSKKTGGYYLVEGK